MTLATALKPRFRRRFAPELPALLPVGTKVTFLFGVTRRVGTIVEHRGPVGKEGERLYRVEFPNGDETFSTELSAFDFDTTL